MQVPGFTKVRMPEGVTIHEFGHNYFQGMIASNEFEESWLDEGINSYYDSVVTEEHYATMIELFGLRAEPFPLNRAQLGAGRYTDSIVTPSWGFLSNSSYGLNSYTRPAVTLRHMKNILGVETFNRAMRRFFQTWRFRHPSSADFEQVFREEVGPEFEWFLAQAFHSDRPLDYRIRTATSRTAKDSRGWFWEDNDEKVQIGPAHFHRGESEEEPADDDDDENELYRTEVIVERRGEFIHPVTVELVFADGERQRHQWDGSSRWVRYLETRSAKLVSAEVDPDHLMVLDIDPLNNSIRLETDKAPATKMVAHLVFWLQNLFELTAMVG
jgi:hypothetical protein